MKRSFVSRISVALIIISTSLSGVSLAQDHEGVTLTFMDWWGPPRSDGYLEIIEAFEREHPGISVEYVRGDARGEQALTMIAGGTSPDVFAINFEALSGVLERGVIAPLNEYLERDGVDPSLFLPGALEASTSYEGVVYGFPKVFNPIHLFANVNAIAEAGLQTPELGWTTSEFEEYVSRLTRIQGDGSTIRYGMTMPAARGWPHIHGGRYYDPQTGTTGITDEAFVRPIAWLADLVARGFLGEMSGGEVQNFLSGQAALLDQAYLTRVPAVMQDEPAFEVATIYLPKGDAPTVTFVAVHPHVISTASKHPDEAWEFLKYLNLSETANTIRAEYGLGPGTVSGMKQVVDLAMLPGNQSRQQVFGPFLQPTSNIAMWPTTLPGFSQAGEYIWPAFDRAIAGEVDAYSAMESIAAGVNEIFSEARSRN